MAIKENFSRYQIEKKVKIFENDVKFQKMLNDHNIKFFNEDYQELVKLFLSNKETIAEHSIEELNNMVPPFLRNEIADIFEVNYMTKDMYYITLYTYKYSTIKTFFLDNYGYYLPDIEKIHIESKEKIKIFQEALMREFDRFADTIEEIANVIDIDKTPDEYLNYIAQSVGYEREDKKLLKDSSFRELIKNIIEIYKIKGTNYSFELFFNFLGFETELKEFWFDKRYGDSGISKNQYTGITDKNNSSFYLTPYKPTKAIPSDMINPYLVSENSIIETLDCNEFNVLANKYGYKQLLGDKRGYEGRHFTFFKTNIIQFNLTSIKALDSDEGEELNAEDLDTIERYVTFLTPIFVKKNIIINIKPYEDDATNILTLSDYDRPDPRSNNPKNTDQDFTNNVNDESMLHLYQGKRPSKYYWEDGLWEEYHSNGFPVNGHFISGYHLNTFNKIYNLQNSESVINKIILNNDFYMTNGIAILYQETPKGKGLELNEIINKIIWSEEEAKQLISILLNVSPDDKVWENKLFEYYQISPRDMMAPFLDEEVEFPKLRYNFDEIFDGGNIQFGHSKEKEKGTFIEGSFLRPFSKQNPYYFPDKYNKIRIKEIKENGEIIISDSRNRFDSLETMSKNTFEKSLSGSLVKNDYWIESINIRNSEKRTVEKNTDYFKGEYIIYNDIVYICLKDFNSGEDDYVKNEWIRNKVSVFNPISLINKDMEIFIPKIVFDAKIVEIDRINNKIKIDKRLPKGYNNFPIDFKFKANDSFIEIINNDENNGIYYVNSYDPVTKTIKVEDTLTEQIGDKLGYINLYNKRWQMYQKKYEVMFDDIRWEREIKEDTFINKKVYEEDNSSLYGLGAVKAAVSEMTDLKDESGQIFPSDTNAFIGQNIIDENININRSSINAYEAIDGQLIFSGKEMLDNFLAFSNAKEYLTYLYEYFYSTKWNELYTASDWAEVGLLMGFENEINDGFKRNSTKFSFENTDFYVDYLDIKVS